MAEFPLSITANAPQLEALFGRIKSSAPAAGRAVDKVSDRANRSAREAKTASRSFDGLSKTYDTTARAARSTSRETKTLTDRQDRLRRSTDRQADSSDKLSRVSKGLAVQLLAVAGGVLSVAAASREIRTALDTFDRLETGVVSVGKTTDLTTQELDEMFDRLLVRSTTDLPITVTRMLELGAAAGQLGVEGSANIDAFITTLGQMEVATDLVGEEGAKALARILNVSGEAQGEVGRLGAVIVALGNEAAASESEIVDLATEVALATAQFRIGSTAAVAIGTAMKEAGVNAEAGGTAIGRTLREIQSAVVQGGDELTAFAEISQVSAEQFRAVWEDGGPVAALNLFLAGLGELGPEASLALERVHLGSDRLAKVLPQLAVNYEKLALRQRQASDEAERMTALTGEAGKFFSRTGADLDRFGNAVTAVRSEVGEGMSPAIRVLALDMRDLLLETREGARTLGEDLGESLALGATRGVNFGRTMTAVLAPVGRLLLTVAENADVVGAALVVLIARSAGLSIASLVSGLVAWVQHLQQVALGAQLAAAAEDRLTASAAANSVVIGASGTMADLYANQLHGVAGSVVATDTVLDLYDAQLVKTGATTGAVTAATGAHAAASNVATGAITRQVGATTALGVAMERLKVAFATNPVGLIITALSALAGILLIVKSRTLQAAEAQDEYSGRLRFGTDAVDSAVIAHQELITKLERELEVRQELAGLETTSGARLEDLRPILDQATSAVQAGDLAAYRQAIDAAEELGVKLSEAGRGSRLEQLRLEVEALEAELGKAAAGMAQSDKAIQSVQEELLANVEDTLDAEVRLRTEQQARLADQESALAKGRAEMAKTDAQTSDSIAGFVKHDLAIQNLAGSVSGLADAVEDANARIKALAPDVENRLGELLRAGDLGGLTSLIEALPDDLFTRIFGDESTVSGVLAEYERAIEVIRRVQAEGEDLPGGGGGGGEPDAEAAKFAKLLESLREQRDLALELTDAFNLRDEAAQRAALQGIEAEQKFADVTRDLTAAQIEALRELGLVQEVVEAERRAAGAQTLSDLDQQIKAQLRTNAAYVSGAEAVAEATQAQKIAEAQAEATDGAQEDQVDTIREWVRALVELQAEEEALRKVRDLDQEARDLDRLADAYDGGIGAVEATQAALRVENEIRSQTIDLLGQERLQVLEAVAARERAGARVGAKDVVAQLEDQVDAAEDLQKIRRRDFLTERQYQEALRRVNVERELEVELNSLRAFQAAEIAALKQLEIEGFGDQTEAIQEVNDAYADLIRRAKGAAGQGLSIDFDVDDSTTKLDAWVEAGRSIADALRGVNDELGAIADAAVDVLASFENIGTAAGKIDFAVAAGDLVATLGQELSGPNNYAAEGGLIGAIIGGIVTGPAGIQAGAAIGGSAGAAMGSFIKKGADEFIAEFRMSAEGDVMGIGMKVEGKMASIGRRYMEAIERGIEDALDQLGAFLVGIPEIGVKVREGVFGVIVGTVQGHFETVEEAVDFAILEILKQGDVIGLSSAVQQAIERSGAETFDKLMEDIDFAKWFERLPEIGQLAGQSATALFDAVDQYQAALKKANDLGFDTAKIDQFFAHTLDAVRDNVLGIVETEEERIRREAEAFNRTVEILRAENLMREAELMTREAELEAKAELLAADLGLSREELEAKAMLLQQKADLTEAELHLVEATLSSFAAVEEALAIVRSIIAGLPDLISEGEIQEAIARAGGAGQGQRRREREDARREIDDLRLLASGLSEAALDLRRELEDFEEWVDASRRLGIAESELAQARIDNLQLLEAELLEPFQGALAGADPAGVRALLDRYVEGLEQAAELAAARAEAAGTSVGEELARLADVLASAFAAELGDAMQETLPGLVSGGDRGGLEDLRESLLDLAASLPPGLVSGLGEVAEALGLVDHALAAMDALGLGGPIAGVDTGSIQDFLDMARGISEVDRELRDLQGAFLAVLVEARLAGASEEELALIHDAYGEALATLKDSVLDSVREYLDAADGIGEFERRLIDLQDTFRQTRDALGVIGGGADAESILFAEPDPANLLAAKIEPALDLMVDRARGAFEEVAAAIEDVFGVEVPVPASPGGGLPQAPRPEDRPRGPFEKTQSVGLGPAEDLPAVLDDVGEAAADLSDDLRDLEAAERRAVQALGIEFIGSLEDLGVALPTELTLELAQAQFALARAEALSSALALAAAGAFAGMSISLGELLDRIAGASFDASSFAPGRSGPGAGGRGAGRGDDLDTLARRVEEQLRAWDRMGLGDATQEAIDFAETLAQVESDAAAAGVSLDRVSESYQRAVATFVNDALSEFEDMDLSPLERELESIEDRFVDLIAAFEVAGASAEDMARLQEAFTTAMEDFLERATSGIRAFAEELRASDPRRSSEQRFAESQTEFQELLARAQGGDLEAIQELEEAARRFREESLSFLGGGVGANEVLDAILAGLDSIGDVEIVPEDIALLREQAKQLLALVEIGEVQPTRDSNDAGFAGVRDAVDEDRTTSESLLDLILTAISEGELEVAGIGDVLQTLAEMVTLVDLSQDDLQRILDTVGGVVQVADELAPNQLASLVNLVASLGELENLTEGQQSQLGSMVQTLLGLESLTDAQRNILLGIDTEADSQGGTLSSILTKVADSAQRLTTQNAFTEPLLRSINVRAGEQRVLLAQIRDLLAAMPTMQSGGLTGGDGLVFLHENERVLNPRDTAIFDTLFRTSGRSADPIVVSREVAMAAQRSGRQAGTGSREQNSAADRVVAEAVVERQAERDAAHMEAVRRSIDRAETRRHRDQRAAAKLAAARIRQGGGELELLAELASEVAALRRDAKRGARGTAGRSR